MKPQIQPIHIKRNSGVSTHNINWKVKEIPDVVSVTEYAK